MAQQRTRRAPNLTTALVIAIIVLLIASMAAVLAVQNSGDTAEVPADQVPAAGESVTHVQYSHLVEGQNVNVLALISEEVRLVPPAPQLVQPIDAAPTQPPAADQQQPVATQPPAADQQQPVATQPPAADQQPITAVTGRANTGVDPIRFIDYVVQAQDTLYSIAKNQTSSIELMARHGIDSEDLVPGAVLKLPTANPDYCPGLNRYVIRDKDTVFRIAQQFGTTKEVIRDINGLGEDYAIQIAGVLCLP